MFGFSALPIILILITSLSGGAFWYYTSTQSTIESLRKNNYVLQEANTTNQETISRMEEAAEFSRELNEELQNKYIEAEAKVNSLRDKLIDHDLTKLSLKKPTLIEKRINDGTSKAFAELESITTVSRVQPLDTGTNSSNKD
jgi:predicted RNase H-like nuclease (RuvC/YqgF family)